MPKEIKEIQNKPLKIGTKTRWGIIKMIGWVGERYYWMVAKDKSVSMMPADVVEPQTNHD